MHAHPPTKAASQPGSGPDSNSDSSSDSNNGISDAEKAPAWDVSWVPAGFIVSDRGIRRHTPKGVLVRWLRGRCWSPICIPMGLSAFSIFLEASSDSPLGNGKAHRGATVAFTRDLVLNGQRFLLTVVGEVPFATAEKVASSVACCIVYYTLITPNVC